MAVLVRHRPGIIMKSFKDCLVELGILSSVWAGLIRL